MSPLAKLKHKCEVILLLTSKEQWYSVNPRNRRQRQIYFFPISFFCCQSSTSFVGLGEYRRSEVKRSLTVAPAVKRNVQWCDTNLGQWLNLPQLSTIPLLVSCFITVSTDPIVYFQLFSCIENVFSCTHISASSYLMLFFLISDNTCSKYGCFARNSTNLFD